MLARVRRGFNGGRWSGGLGDEISGGLFRGNEGPEIEREG